MNAKYLLVPVLFLAWPALVLAQVQSQYVTNQFQVGLHEEKSLDSPIIQLVPSNSRLEIIKRDDQASFVKEPGGASGWIDNSYLMDQAATTAGGSGDVNKLKNDLAQAEIKIRQLEQSITDTDASNAATKLQNLRKQHKDVQQQFKDEKIKSGKLSVELAELRKRIGQTNDNASMFKQLEQLEQDKKRLEIELSKAMELSVGDGKTVADIAASHTSISTRNLMIYILFAALLGIGFGLYLMDLMVRRRHGGFRV